jgi:hypothetical protein
LNGYEPENTVVVARWSAAAVAVRRGGIDEACGIFDDIANTLISLDE